MATDEITMLDDTMGMDTSLIEYEFKKIHTEARDINTSGGPISFDILNENAFTVPSDSYLLVEGRLTKDDGSAYTDANEVTLAKEGILHLFREVRYQINDKDVESIFYPGVCQNMLSYLLEDDGYDKSTSLIHCGVKDDHTDASTKDNKGFAKRKVFVLSSNTKGTFSFMIPLRRLFGFFRDYNKVVFGTTQRLTLTPKGHSNDAIFRDDAAGDGKVTLKNIYWMVPHAVGTDEVNLALLNRIRSKKQIDIAYRGITCSRNEVQSDTTFMWRLGARQSPEVPRYVLIAFQTDKEGKQKTNSSLFDHVNLTKLRVMVNEKQYPSIEYTTDFEEHQFSRLYMDTMNFKGKFFNVESTEKEITSAPGMNPIEYKDLFPIFVVDVSKQTEKVKHTLSEVTIHAEFSSAVTANTRAFCTLISDKFIKLESDGNRLALVQ